MTKLVFTFYLVCLSFLTYTQNYQITWQKCFGGSEQDIAYDIVELTDGYFITGYTWSNDGDVSLNNGLLDGWLIKTDTVGNILWEKTYGGSSGDGFRQIFPDNLGNYILVGGSGSSDGDISYDPYPNSEDFWFVKIDIEGNIIWDKIVGGSDGGEHIWSASPTFDGGVVAVGWTYSTDGNVSVSYGGADTWAVKISSEGELEWDYTIGTDWIDKGYAILATSDGGYLISSSSSIHDDAVGNITCTPHSYGWTECVLFKLDSNLNLEWQKCYGGSNHDGVYGIIELDDGYMFSSYTASNDGDVTGHHGEADIWIVKIDFLGNIIWQKCLGGSNTEYANILYQTSTNEIIIAGNTRSNNGDVSGNHGLSEFDTDIWFIKLSSEGELLYQQCIGGAGSEELYFGVVKKSDNNFVIAGQSDYGPSYDVGCAPHGNLGADTDWWVFEIKDCTQYAPTIPTTPAGEDTVCNQGSEPYLYTISPAALAWDYEWALQPDTAGTLTTDTLEALVEWADDFTGTATLVARSTNDCGFSEWSAPKYVQVNNCLGTGENMESKIRVFPNPAKEYVKFEVKSSKFEVGSEIRVMNVMGEEVARLPVETERTVWDCRDVKEGVYFYQMDMEGSFILGKFIIQR